MASEPDTDRQSAVRAWNAAAFLLRHLSCGRQNCASDTPSQIWHGSLHAGLRLSDCGLDTNTHRCRPATAYHLANPRLPFFDGKRSDGVSHPPGVRLYASSES